MPQPINKAWQGFLTEGLPLRHGSWLLNSQAAMLHLGEDGVARFTLVHGKEAIFGAEHLNPVFLATKYSLILTNGVTLQLLIAQGGSTPVDLVARLAKFELQAASGISYSIPERPWFEAHHPCT